MNKILKYIFSTTNRFKRPTHSNTNQLIAFNAILITFQLLYLALRFKYLNSIIPFWYTYPWGNMQLAPKSYIFLLPLLSIALLLVGTILYTQSKQLFIHYGYSMLLYLTSLANALLTVSLFRIIKIASTPFEPLINPQYLNLAAPLLLSSGIAYFFTPIFIEYAKRGKLVTDPSIHRHPGMLLQKPSARGGGVIFALAFIVTAIVFIPFSKQLIGLLAAVAFAALIGLLDDKANTSPSSKFTIFGKPLLRLIIFQPLTVVLILAAGIQIKFIGNPFDGIVLLDQLTYKLGTVEFAPVAIIVTVLWAMWVMNLLSWSNGVDGQFAGIISIAGIVIALLSLRLIELEPKQVEIAKLAIIAAGASLGLLPYTWHPSKIMWGFGATAAGIVLATLSIITRAKIATATLVLLIPFLDALITVIRRLLEGKAPYKGDRGHLHHLLLKRGWGIKRIALFYWGTTALFGALALLSSDKAVPLVVLTLGGAVAFIILTLNLRLRLKKPLL